MKRLLLPLLAAIALPTAVNANVDPKVAEMCMKATDFQGCVNAMTGIDQSSIKKKELLDEIKKLPSRIANTSLRDFLGETRSFRDKLALSSAEEVGQKLYKNAKKLELALDVLYKVREREVEVKSFYASAGASNNEYLGWDGQKNYKEGKILNSIFEGLTIDVRCFRYGFVIKGYKDFPSKVSLLIATFANEIVKSNGSYYISQETYKIPANDEIFCKGDPRRPKKVKKEDSPLDKKKPLKINCKSAVWRDKPRCN